MNRIVGTGNESKDFRKREIWAEEAHDAVTIGRSMASEQMSSRVAAGIRKRHWLRLCARRRVDY